ncbi:GNAT family N-acetyltransferase [Kibdelosporangium philippinense]|uniref:GNAT family N-acetyltransferase n=1 Tax=Kibdelosporangium philippinense TaxID=211113 RepID=A0ABS8ZSQ4_9PSEU|nr:GNAT family N-acetyltransferase [Kibdelosporangium philippinense]MCE7009468.1 GNAT family N-acetyltransferase [Kibdelosporangium philippinense]
MLATRYYLQQTSPDQLKPAKKPDIDVQLVRSAEPSPEFNRYLYTAVGSDWYWAFRLGWDWQQWMDWLTEPGHETWVAWVRGTPAGYAELVRRDGDVEIENFGLVPSFIGRGLGGHLLTEVLRRAWEVPGTTRVWLHTNTLDSTQALHNYQARGMTVFQVEDNVEKPQADGAKLEPWPGANRAAPPSPVSRAASD